MIKLSFTLLCTVVLLSLGGCTSSTDTQPTDTEDFSNKIIYNALDYANENIPPHVVLISPDGSGAKTIGNGLIVGYGKNKIAMVPTDFSGVFVSKPDGSNSVKVISRTLGSQKLSGPAVMSANGEKIAFEMRDTLDYTYHYYITNSDGSNRMEISGSISSGTFPVFSPDAKKLAFYKKAVKGSTLAVFDIESQLITDIYTTSFNLPPDGQSSISWSPNGSKLVFQGNNDVYVAASDGSDTQLLNAGWYPEWSPDGNKIAYVNNGDIYIANSDGSNVENITNTTSLFEGYPSWSPDSKKLVILSWQGDFDQSTGSLEVIDIVSKASKVIATPSERGFWLP